MKIAVINETSAADKNKDVLAALEGRGHEIIPRNSFALSGFILE